VRAPPKKPNASNTLKHHATKLLATLRRMEWGSGTALVPQSVGGRLKLMLVISTVVILLLGALGLFAVRTGKQSADTLFEYGVVNVGRMGDLREAFNRLARFEMDMIVNFESPPLTEEAKKHWNEAHALALQRIADIETTATTDAAKASIGVIRAGLTSYLAGMKSFIPKMEKGEVLSASVGNQLMLEHRQGFNQAGQALDELRAEVTRQTADRRHQASLQAGKLVTTSAVSAVFGLTLTVLIGWLIVRSVNQQIRAASALTHRIAEGDLTPDEGAGRRPAGEVGALMESLDTMSLSLRQLATGVKYGAQEVTTASSEIASGSLDLTHRTEHAAASLMEISSNLQKLNQSAMESSQLAQDAARLAGTVASEATTASVSSTDAVRRMQDIRQHAARIAEITGVIDSIAFQSNLLALNAAVEAAHAGDVGKGFGVVANEIQVLARRSGDAARDIKKLLEESQVSIDAGVNAVDRAEQSVKGISGQVIELSQLTGSLADDAVMQTRRIDDAARTTSSLENSTQQNSALAEQSTAAADTLRMQAEQLRELVDVFRV